MAQNLSPCLPCRRAGLCSRLLALAWSSPGCQGQLGKEPANGRYVSLRVCAFQIKGNNHFQRSKHCGVSVSILFGMPTSQVEGLGLSACSASIPDFCSVGGKLWLLQLGSCHPMGGEDELKDPAFICTILCCWHLGSKPAGGKSVSFTLSNKKLFQKLGSLLQQKGGIESNIVVKNKFEKEMSQV